jgi:hypothetical protein
MRTFYPAFAFLLAAGITTGLAQTTPPPAPPVSGARPGNVIGTGSSLPRSNNASNIDPSNTRSEIAPTLPVPPVEGTRDLLMTASQDLSSARTGAAQEALERAQARLMNRSVARTMANAPDDSRVVGLITQARMALGRKDLQAANSYVQQALQSLSGG